MTYSVASGVCITEGCSGQGSHQTWGMCPRCYRAWRQLGIEPAEYVVGVAGQCEIAGCTASGKLQLDHDNTCCKKVPSGGRCGGCNRGFLCAKHNRTLSWFEGIEGWDSLTDAASLPFVDYLRKWRDAPRQEFERKKLGNYSQAYIARTAEKALQHYLGLDVTAISAVDPSYEEELAVQGEGSWWESTEPFGHLFISQQWDRWE